MGEKKGQFDSVQEDNFKSAIRQTLVSAPLTADEIYRSVATSHPGITMSFITSYLKTTPGVVSGKRGHEAVYSWLRGS
jgi:hypothetical protein